LKPKVDIIVLSWNQKEQTLRCLKSLAGLDYPNFQVLLVDNGSEDGSAQAVAEKFPHFELLALSENLKVTGGRNRGYEEVRDRDQDYILFLDNDTVADPAFLTGLVNAMEANPSAAACSAKIYLLSDEKSFWYAGGEIKLSKLWISLRGYGEKDVGQFDELQKVDHITGCCFFVRARVLADLGVFDPEFVYGEDTEWCVRATKAGHDLLYVPESLLYHDANASWSGGKVRQVWGRVVLHLLKKHGSPGDWVRLMANVPSIIWRSARHGGARGNLIPKIRGALAGLRAGSNSNR